MVMLLLLVSMTLGLLNLNESPYRVVTKQSHKQLLLVPADTLTEQGTEWILLPILFKSPDTGWAGGLLPQVVFRNEGSMNPSQLRLDAYYTQKKQYHLLLSTSSWFRNDSMHFTGRLSLKHWPANFFGIGNHSDGENQIPFIESMTDVRSAIYRRTGSAWLIGAGYRFRYGSISYPPGANETLSSEIHGSQTSYISGVTAGLTYDTRNHHFFPTQGSLMQFEYFNSFKRIGSEYKFSILKADARVYLPIGTSQTVAIQGVLAHSRGDVPFRTLPSVGNVLRGYSTVRYIDQNLIAARLEYRFVPVTWKIGFSIFAGISDVFNRPADLSLRQTKYSVGAGFRFVFSKDEKINIRYDYSSGKDGPGDYLDVQEAF